MRERPNTGTGWRKLVLGPGVGNLDTFPLSIACALRFLTQFCFSWLPLAKFWRYIPIFHNHFDFAIVDSTTKSKPFLLWVWRDVRSNKWKKLRLLDWPRTMAWARLGYTRSSPLPKASTRLEIRTSVKHGLDQILTSTQPRGSHSCQLLSIDLYGGFVWCHPIPWPVQIHMFPSQVNWSRLKIRFKFWFLPSRRSHLSNLWATLTSTSVFGVTGHSCCSIKRVVSCVCHSSSVTFPR